MTGQPDQQAPPGAPAEPGPESIRSLSGRLPRPAAEDTAGRHAAADLRQADLRQAELRPPDSGRESLTARLWRLPAGHPSSPYDGDGRLRPPVPDWRESGWSESGGDGDGDAAPGPARGAVAPERRSPGSPEQRPAGNPEPPIPGNEQTGRPESTGSRADSVREADPSWLDALPGLQARWRQHEEKWPASERPPADRSADEPGSWRGDSGHYLNFEENLVSDHARGRVGKIEEKTTPVLLDIKAAVAGAEIVGLDFRLKGDGRFKEKVADELRAKPERVISAISENMPDAMRYTYQFEGSRYTSGYWDVHRNLTDRGFALDFRRNSWDSGQYKGLNTRWRTPEGQLFEIQFHTPESFAAKQITHGAYERIRSPATSDHERDDLYAFQSEACAHVPLPEGALAIPDYREASSELHR